MKKLLTIMFVVAMAAACGKKNPPAAPAEPAPAAPMDPAAPAEGEAPAEGAPAGDAPAEPPAQ